MVSRTKYTQKNMAVGLLVQILKIILSFVSRTIFIRTLGSEYLGLNGLFTNVLSMMSLAELGVGGALTYSLYEPLAQGNDKKLQILMNLYKKAYLVIGSIIATMGIALLPFLQYLVNFDGNVSINYHAIYLLFLLDSVATYFFAAYRSSILQASQQEYVVNTITSIFDWITVILQLIVLLFVKSYYAYLIVKIIVGIIKNEYIAYVAGKKFPMLNKKCTERLDKEEKTKIVKNVYAMLLTKISAKVYSSTDNIIISGLLGTILVGYYSNYNTIVYSVTSVIGIVLGAAKASIGNLNVLETTERKFLVFEKILFVNMWGYSLAAICLMQLLSPFVNLWLGNEFVLDSWVVLTIVLNFLISGLNHTVSIFKDACGLFWQTRYRTVATAVVNLISSIILAHWLGLAGVFLGTIISYIVTILPYDPYVLYREVFHRSVVHFYVWYIKAILITVIGYLLVHLLCRNIDDTIIWGFLLETVVTLGISNLVLIFFNYRKKEFHYYLSVLKGGLQNGR